MHPDHPALVAAHVPPGCRCGREIDLAVERLRARATRRASSRSPGTNGKTTVTTLIAAMLARGRASRSAAAGNIGRPLLDAAGDDVDVVVAEVSSFQLALDRPTRSRPTSRSC